MKNCCYFRCILSFNLYRTGTVYENEIIQKIYSISLKINMLLYHLLNFYIEKIVPVFLFFLHIVVWVSYRVDQIGSWGTNSLWTQTLISTGTSWYIISMRLEWPPKRLLNVVIAAVCDGPGDAGPAAVGGLPLRPPLLRVRPHHHVLEMSCFLTLLPCLLLYWSCVLFPTPAAIAPPPPAMPAYWSCCPMCNNLSFFLSKSI